MKRCASLCLLLALSGCATAANPLAKRTYTPVASTSEVVKLPALEVETLAEVGQSMISTVKRISIPAIKLDSDLVHRGPYYGDTFTITVPAGYLIFGGRDNEGRFFHATPLPRFKMDKHRDTIQMKGGVYVPNDKSSSPEIFWISTTDNKPRNDVIPNLAVVVQENFHLYDKESFRRELVYSGVSQNSISILYREFKDDFARPSFSQDLKYDLAQGNEIGFRGARFQIISATNTGIRYKVLRPLD